jgi:cytoskeleton protein RodZ
MSDESTRTEEQDEGPVGGERLRVARRANDISVRDVAKELHLDEYKVRALEKNEFDVLGAPVFAKGHLRKYAEMVGVSIDDVMTDYYQMNRATGAPPVVGSRPRPPREINLVPWIAAAVIAVLVAGAAWWWFGLRSPAPAPVAEPAALAPFIETPAADDTAAEPGPEPEPVAVDPAPETPAAATSSPDAPEQEAADTESPATASYEPTPGAPQVSIALSFSGDCWTEVSDGSGRRLFYDLGSAGRIVSLSGDAPLRLILGDADNVSITVAGEPWPIPQSARRGRLARLSIAAR